MKGGLRGIIGGYKGCRAWGIEANLGEGGGSWRVVEIWFACIENVVKCLVEVLTTSSNYHQWILLNTYKEGRLAQFLSLLVEINRVKWKQSFMETSGFFMESGIYMNQGT